VAQEETMTDFSDMARGIIESNRYMVLGTADEGGVPWVTPVWFAQSEYRRFIWV
jgi:predicted pyridoxine 5'-phosphate oxidase superfamily flavin-nucleotide-binding protein